MVAAVLDAIKLASRLDRDDGIFSLGAAYRVGLVHEERREAA